MEREKRAFLFCLWAPQSHLVGHCEKQDAELEVAWAWSIKNLLILCIQHIALGGRREREKHSFQRENVQYREIPLLESTRQATVQGVRETARSMTRMSTRKSVQDHWSNYPEPPNITTQTSSFRQACTPHLIYFALSRFWRWRRGGKVVQNRWEWAANGCDELTWATMWKVQAQR